MSILIPDVPGAYALFYLAGVALTATIAWREAGRRGWDRRNWTIVLAACALGGIIGARTLMFDLEMAAAGEKTVLGALAGGGLALVIAGRLLGFGPAAMDVFMLGTPIGMAVGRIGCFLAGCCGGRVTEGAWGVRYAPGSEPFLEQVAARVIPASAPATLAVHPAQLYEGILDLIIGVVVWRASRSPAFRRPGAVALLGVGLLAAVRFSTEWVRSGGTSWHGLTTTQWTLALVMLATVVTWRLMSGVRGQNVSTRSALAARPSLVTRVDVGLIVLMTIAVVAFALDAWFSPVERVVARLAIVGATLAAVIRHTRTQRAPVTYFASAFLLCQAAAIQVPADTTWPLRFLTLGASVMGGEWTDEDCGGATQKHTYSAAAMTLGYREESKPGQGWAIRGVASHTNDTPGQWVGAERYRRDSMGSWRETAVAVSATRDWRKIGLTVGARVAAENREDPDIGEPIFPIGVIRIGPLSRWGVELHVGDHEPSPFPRPQGALNLFVGVDNGSIVRLGIGGAGPFASARIVTAPHGWEIEPMLASGSAYEGSNASLSIRKRFGFRKQ